MLSRSWIGVMLLIFAAAAHTSAQATCAALVDAALTAAGENCQGLTAGTACYGFAPVEAEFTDGAAPDVLNRPASRADLAQLERISTFPADSERTEWGVAALHTTDDAGNAVLSLMMGETTLVRTAGTFATFRYRTNPDVTPCSDEAPSLVALRTEDDVTADVQINGEPSRLNGVVTLRWQSPNSMTVTVHRGQFALVNRETPPAGAGETLSAVMNNDGRVSFWSAPRPAADAERALAAPVVRLYNDMGFPTEIESCTYIVQAGDNLYRIGLRYGQTVDEIAAANNITNPDMIAAGQELVVPCVEVERAAAPPAANTSNPPDAPRADCDVMYAFGSGDTLQQLETLFDTSAGEIAHANDFAPGELPGAGQEIFIPCVP